MKIERFPFGTFYNQSVRRIVLSNENGMSVSILELGGIISNLLVPDKQGDLADVVLGFDNIKDYVRHDTHYFGALIGRVANRIEGAQFELDGEMVQVHGNAYGGRHCVHGGRFGYHRRVWQQVKSEQTHDHVSVTLRLIDNDGEEGFKHTVLVHATYTLTRDNKLSLIFNADADGPTPVNMTAHSYFNLFGHQHGSIKAHTLTLHAKQYLGQKADRIPDGSLVSVDDSMFDFSQTRVLAKGVAYGDEVNHSYVFDQTGASRDKLHKMAVLQGGGRQLTIYSNERTLHLYNGHNLDGVSGKQGSIYNRYAGLCLEPKGYVNGINEINFPYTIIDSSNSYEHRIIYDFSH
ncbi:aldose epimerase family protein [Vibrio sp. TH_r3]|uniref:aldose epimerase family protein n=1 Tax=Vibrio sp. TH_r3 TaxID=3082084 RepID=UPI002953C0DB|nr:aldose epimerase family protein [Vibrio sp. TH_r3]MDV7105521.1 aldose epimerase family protein [Vibrio sp. TH_r3]